MYLFFSFYASRLEEMSNDKPDDTSKRSGSDDIIEKNVEQDMHHNTDEDADRQPLKDIPHESRVIIINLFIFLKDFRKVYVNSTVY